MRNGSPEFYALLEKAGELHNKKSHDYANNSDPFGNYHFAGKLSKLFDNPDDSGFVGRIGEKLFRLANLENSNKVPNNESIEDTEVDLVVIMTLWMADRKTRRKPKPLPTVAELEAILVSDHLQGVNKLQFTKPPSSNPEKKILSNEQYNMDTICFFCKRPRWCATTPNRQAICRECDLSQEAYFSRND